jgi:hypothetical protein
MDKRGQLVQIFEFVGTILVVFLFGYVAYSTGSGEATYKAYLTKDLALTADALYINPGEEIVLEYAVDVPKYDILIKTSADGVAAFHIPQATAVLTAFLGSEPSEFVTKEFQSLNQELRSPAAITLMHSNNLLEVEKK